MRHGTPVRHLVREGDRVRVVTQGGDLVARRVVVAVGAWSAGLLGPLLAGPPSPGPAGLPLVVTHEQPAHFVVRDPATEGTWPSFTHDPGPDAGWPSGVYGLATPGEGVKVGFHGVGPVTDPDRRSYLPEPGQLTALRDYVRTWLPGLDPDHLVPVSCTYTTTPDHDFVLDRHGPLVVGAGFSGHGFKFATAVGRVLADLATDDGAATAARFALHRFAAPSHPVRSGSGASHPVTSHPVTSHPAAPRLPAQRPVTAPTPRSPS